MQIRSHSESHLVELDDGSKWQIFPGDLAVTLNWQPNTELKLVRIDDRVSSHALVSINDNSSVRVLPEGEKWPVDEVRTVLKESAAQRLKTMATEYEHRARNLAKQQRSE